MNRLMHYVVLSNTGSTYYSAPCGFSPRVPNVRLAATFFAIEVTCPSCSNFILERVKNEVPW